MSKQKRCPQCREVSGQHKMDCSDPSRNEVPIENAVGNFVSINYSLHDRRMEDEVTFRKNHAVTTFFVETVPGEINED